MRPPRQLLALVAAAGVIVAACGRSDEGSERVERRLGGQQLEVVGVWTGEEEANFARVLDLFEKRTGARVRFTSTGDDLATALDSQIQLGTPPDVAMLPQPGLLRDLVARKVLRPLDAASRALVDRNYDEEWRRLAAVDGTLYGVWYKAANKSTFWYRTKAFFDARVAPPRTWEQLQDVARSLTEKGVTPLAVGAAEGWALTDWFENVYLRTAGPAKYDQLARHEIPWTDGSVKHALRTLGQVLGRPEWVLGGPEGALATDFDKSVIDTFGNPPRAAMTFEGGFVAINITRDTDAEVGRDARFFDFPSIAGSKRSVVVGGDVAVLLKDGEAGRELVRFLATPEAAELWAEAGGFASPNKAVDPAAYPDLTSRQLARTLTETEIVRFDLSDLLPASFGATIGQGLWKILQDWLKDPTDVDGVAARLEQAANAVGR